MVKHLMTGVVDTSEHGNTKEILSILVNYGKKILSLVSIVAW